MAENENGKISETYDPKLYDLTFGTKEDDIPFYIEQAKAVDGKVLEVACGTGRVYLELLKEGVDAYGIDISVEMLKALKEKAKVLKLRPLVEQADMRNFNLQEGFSLIMIPFRSFLHNLTIDDQVRTLKNCRRHLVNNGKLVLNFFFPNPEIISNNYGKEIKRSFNAEEGQFELINKSYFVDEPEQVIECIFIWRKDNLIVSRSRLALIYKREFELLLKLAGFRKWQVYGGFEYQPLVSYKQEMVWVVEK